MTVTAAEIFHSPSRTRRQEVRTAFSPVGEMIQPRHSARLRVRLNADQLTPHPSGIIVELACLFNTQMAE
jgi:hypothetical protein